MYIRQAKTSDAAAIAPLFNQYREFYKQASDLKGAEAFLRARLENDESIILTAEENGEFIGFTQLYPTFSSVAMKRIYILNDLFVAPHARTKGAGGQLLSAAKDFAAENGAKSYCSRRNTTTGRQEAYMSKTAMKKKLHLSIIVSMCQRSKIEA